MREREAVSAAVAEAKEFLRGLAPHVRMRMSARLIRRLIDDNELLQEALQIMSNRLSIYEPFVSMNPQEVCDSMLKVAKKHLDESD